MAFTKRREGIEHFVVSSIAIATVGAGSWLWSTATNDDFLTRTFDPTWVV